MTELDALRDKIDEVDKEIVRLLEKRMGLSREIGACKAAYGMPVLDAQREEAVIQRCISLLQNKANADAIREVYKHIMQFSRENQGGKQ